MLAEGNTSDSRELEEKKQYSPIVFVNNPVKDPAHDVIGFDAQVATLQNAIDDGATMIGVIADYGTGKSSMTELLCDRFKKKRNPKPIKINMWDSLTQENITRDASGVSNLTRSFLFQLAKGKSAAFSSYINKLLSKNYGNISFASSNPSRFGLFAIVAGILFGMHMMGAVSGTGVMAKLPVCIKNVVPFVKALSPWFLVLAIASLLLGLRNLSIAFSYWKMPTKRELEINDVFDTYRLIAKKLTPRCAKKKQLVFIDDLDRVNDKKIIIAFLKELYRFQDATTTSKNPIVFIISVKPESELQDYTSHQASSKDINPVEKSTHIDAEKAEHAERVNETSLIYPKVFDTTLFLKPIHFDDYDPILLRLIMSSPEKKAALEDLIGKKIDISLPSSFRWIKNGSNLTLRDLKDRLNHAIAIMVSLKNKSYENNSAADFNACTAVAYLESQFPNDYYRLIKNEGAFAKFIKRSYKIVDANKVEENIDELKKFFEECFKEEKYSEPFVKALCGMVMEKTFKDDFRMYFYTYPKDSHIKTTEEREICNCLLFPNQYPIPTNLDDCVTHAYKAGKNDTIEKTLASLDAFPSIVIENETLLDHAINVSMTKTFAVFFKRVIEADSTKKQLHEYWTRILGIEGINKERFINLCIQKLAAISDSEIVVQKRLDIIKGLEKDVLLFKDLFVGIDSMPQITNEEIKIISDPDIFIPLISIDNIDVDQRTYLCAALNSTKLISHKDVWDKAVDIMRAFTGIVTPKEIGYDIWAFLKNNRFLDDEMFSVVCSADISHEKIAEYVNEFGPSELSKTYYTFIDQLGFSTYIKEPVVYAMMEQTLFFTPILFYVQNDRLHQMDKFLEHSERIRDACTKINDIDPDIVIVFRKHCLTVKADNLYDLFFGKYPLITIDEYRMFEQTADAIHHINAESVDEDRAEALLQVIYAREYYPEDIIGLFEYLFKPDVNPNCIQNVSAVEAVIDNIEFGRFHTQQLTYEQRSRLYESFSDRYPINNSESAINFTRHFGCFIPDVEKIISADTSVNAKYRALIVELDELSDVALLWVKKYYFTAPASEKLCNILFEKGMYTDYIIATILREKRMIMDPRIDFSVYIEVYAEVEDVFDIMSDHWDFLEELQQLADYSQLKETHIIPMFKVPQTERFFTYMLSDKTPPELKKRYLKEFQQFKEEKDSIAFQRLICRPENIKLVDSVELKENIYQRLWDSNRTHKGLFTRFWNKEWAKKLSQAQPV